MQNNRLVAVACFAVAIALYYISSSTGIAGILFGLGLLFELAGWKNLFKERSRPA